ncbi:hypothetical protein ACFFWD_11630 [Bradyrhizobium erythrophlei]|uniref:hypothetical protein n=1 Tax=Bradyrhizobium erythrophlei TaxID=1437360 RepID=UPI0035E8F5EB
MRCIIILLTWFASIGLGFSAEGSKPGDFPSAIQSIMANLRTAASYTRTGNIALAQIETEAAVAAWDSLQPSATIPSPTYQPAAVAEFLDKGRQRLATATAGLGNGDNDAAGRELLALRQSFHDLRRRSGLYDLGDCIFEIAPAMEKMRAAAIRLGEQPGPPRAEDTIAAASAFRDRLQRCDSWASTDVAKQPEFRRLIDGAITSAGEIAHAAMAGDGPLVHRYLIELQSYAQLLDFRFG